MVIVKIKGSCHLYFMICRPISKSEICKILPDVSPTTVEAMLGKMVKNGIITTVGSGRGIKYIRK